MIDFNFFDYLVNEVIHKGAVSTTFFKINWGLSLEL